MTYLDCIVLVDCMSASLFLFSWWIYCELYDESQIFLALPKLPAGRGGGRLGPTFRRQDLWDRLSHNQQVLKLEGWLE